MKRSTPMSSLASGAFKSHRVNTTDWNDKEKSEQWRSSWAAYANRALEQKGLTERIDHRSYARQGVEQIPTVHMKVAATQMEHRGIITEKGTVNREIAAQNKLLKEIKARITRLYNWSKEQSKQPGEKRSVLEQLRQAQNAAKPNTTYGKVKALKENAAIFNFLMENGIASMQELYEKISAMNSDYYSLRGEIVSSERQLANLNERLSMWEQYTLPLARCAAGDTPAPRLAAWQRPIHKCILILGHRFAAVFAAVLILLLF